ncbi:hypothetical protein L917_14708 [Phytophthora nicotianae]|uniref:Uncharacterized protein n=1 Tax=Phytophthora nicotianae TaxID=4792 RepID=W2KL82_PHYNI|nr:hypothetical protein L917_14708 [Phytophthora nicotianae]
MAPSAHVFVFDMGEGTTRFFMNRADPSTFEEAFTLELRKDNAKPRARSCALAMASEKDGHLLLVASRDLSTLGNVHEFGSRQL